MYTEVHHMYMYMHKLLQLHVCHYRQYIIAHFVKTTVVALPNASISAQWRKWSVGNSQSAMLAMHFSYILTSICDALRLQI